MHDIWPLLLFLLQLSHGAHVKGNAPEPAKPDDGTECLEREITNRTVLGGLLVKSGAIQASALTLNDLPNCTYVEFAFNKPILVRGWELRGREGSMFGPFAERRGFVASYVVTYVSSDGEVEIVANPEDDSEEFVSNGNLARPARYTRVELDEGKEVRTNTLRLAPIVWSGVPYMAVRLFYCGRDSDLTDEQKQKSQGKAHLPFTYCANRPSWRYAAKPTPVDHFSARGNPKQAWRAIMGVTYTPYLFPTSGADSHHHRLLEIIFKRQTRVEAIKVGGLGEAGEDNGRWGAVTKFSLLYKDPKTDQWLYYSDSEGIPRVFTVGNRTRETAHKVGMFRLPVPLTTEALGFFPHEWINKPYLSLDILACYIAQSARKGQDTAVLVSKTSYFSNSDRNASKAQDDMTQRKHKITFSEETEEIVNEQRSKTNLSQAETSTPSVNASSASLQNNTQKEGTGKNETNTGKEEAEKAVNASSSSLQKNTQGEGTGKNDTNTKKEEDEQEEEEERAKAEDKGELEQEPISVESTGTDTEDESDEATNDINAEKEDAEKVEEEEQEEEEEEEERVDVEYKGELEPEPISVESTGTETEDESDETTNEINIDIEKEKKELEPFITAMKSGIEENISKKKLKPKLIVSQSQSKPRNEKKVKGNKHLPNKWEAGNDEGSSEIETRTGDGNETQLESKVERSQVLNEASVLEGAVATMEKLGKGSVTETSKGKVKVKTENEKKPVTKEKWERPAEIGKWKKPAKEGKWKKPAAKAKLKKLVEKEKLKKTAEKVKWQKPAKKETLKKPAKKEKWKKPAKKEKRKKPAEKGKLKKPAKKEQLKKPAEKEKLKKPTKKEQLKKSAEKEKLKKHSEKAKWKKPAKKGKELTKTQKWGKSETEEPEEKEIEEKPAKKGKEKQPEKKEKWTKPAKTGNGHWHKLKNSATKINGNKLTKTGKGKMTLKTGKWKTTTKKGNSGSLAKSQKSKKTAPKGHWKAQAKSRNGKDAVQKWKSKTGKWKTAHTRKANRAQDRKRRNHEVRRNKRQIEKELRSSQLPALIT